ncbi:ATP-binding protein [Candidatus Bipolaricaulota bacterium]|nr:ATP-binding protein [Candidatus Bipolaricaulota bacterium]
MMESTKALTLGVGKDGSGKVEVPACEMAHHVAVLGGTGAGKSFFLARLLEELLIRTKARIIVLDSNADYVRMSSINSDVWTDSELAKWLLDDDCKDEFEALWQPVRTRVISRLATEWCTDLPKLSWRSLSTESRESFFSQHLLQHAPVRAFLTYTARIADNPDASWANQDYPARFRISAYEMVRHMLGNDMLSTFPVFDDIPSSPGGFLAGSAGAYSEELDSVLQSDIWTEQQPTIENVLTDPENRFVVFDLPSLSLGERFGMVLSVVDILWNHCEEQYKRRLLTPDEKDRRLAHFLIVDEAHNWIPNAPGSRHTEILAERFKRVVAEGRKFGLFLIVVTQRPRKVAADAIDLCDLLFILRMTCSADLDYVSESHGIDPTEMAECKEFSVGECLAEISSAKASFSFHASPPRTKQGGSNVSRYWCE